MTASVQRADLGRLDRLADGAQAVVYRVPDLQLPGEQGPFVFKEYRRSVNPNGPQLHRLVSIRNDELEAAAKRELDLRAIWPVAVVEHSGAVVGLILKEIPPRFFAVLALYSGHEHVPREIQHLMVERAVSARAGIRDFDREARLYICRDISYVYALLHKRDLVYGDLNARNVIVGVEPPSGLLVDCDGIREVGSAGNQLHSPDWEPPEGEYVQSVSTDLYKLGLLILRVLAPGHQASVARNPGRLQGVLDAEGVDLLEHALREHGDRTRGKAWYRYFSRCLGIPVRSSPTGSDPVLPTQPSSERLAADPTDENRGPVHGGWKRNPTTGKWERA